MDDETRYENALKYTPVWLECFLIFALAWTFNPVLSATGQKELDVRLRAKYEAARSDIGQYQRERKKKEKDAKKKQKNDHD